MKFIKNLKHIFFTAIISILLVISFGIFLLGNEFTGAINGFFIYRTGGGVWQDTIHKHTLSPSQDIVIIKIDEKTLNALQAKNTLKMLSIPKQTYAELLERLESVGVKGIAFDIIFQNADTEEASFADVMTRYNNIVLAMMGYTGGDCVVDASGTGATCPGVPRSVYKDITWGSVDMDNAYTRPQSVDISHTPYGEWKSGSGESRVYTLPMALMKQVYTGSDITLPRENTILGPYFGPPNTYPSVSLIDVLDFSQLDMLQNFMGKYVFIGESGTAIHDAFISPVTGTMMDGVESHAHFLDGLLQNKMLVKLDDAIMFLLVIALTIVSVFIYFSVPKYLSPIFAIFTMVLVLWASRILYDNQRIVVDIFLLFLAGGVITYPVTYIYRFFVVDREKRELQNNFGHYIDPHVVEEIASRGEEIVLGGERRTLSVLFSDIAGFTTISESLDPQELFYLMTSYLSNMTDILIGEGGTLDKYIGDAVMGFFGAPLAYTDHATRACRTALAMRAKLPLFNTDLSTHGMKPIDFRVGIATGEVMVGNIGSHDRFNYTVLGDTVNLASRLEGTGKEYDVHIIIAASTRGDIPDEFVVRELDTIAVKGKTEGVVIYELLGYKNDITDMSIYTRYEEALGLYRTGQYLQAGQLWESQMDIDPPSRIMAMRCLSVLKGEIQVEQGVYHMTHK